MKRLFLALALFLAPFAAHAQSSPGLTYGQVPTAAQWNSYFAAKQDYTPGSGYLTGMGTSGHLAKWSAVTGVLQDGGLLPLAANPAASAGLSAVNGVATTFMRSDAAPALSQAIVPTWSGVHTFTLAPVFTAQAGTRTALGLGTAATVATGTSGATIPLLNGANTFSGATIFSSTVTPTGGIVGVTGASNASAGQVGEYIFSQILAGSAVSTTTGAVTNVTSISLTAGDWDVWGNVVSNPASGTTTTQLGGAISLVSATVPTPPGSGGYVNTYVPATVNLAPAITSGQLRVSIASTTTVYLVGVASFSGSTESLYGFIGARRVR